MYAGRKGKSKRVVLAEVFTVAHANSTVASTMATAALLKTFKPAELAVIAYFQRLKNQPPDPLACKVADERSSFYEKQIENLPVMLLDGNKVAITGGGPKEFAQERYDAYVAKIEPLLEEKAGAELTVKATRKGDKVSITTEVSKLTAKGDDIRLRLVLVEPTVNYKGANGQTVYHNVARAMPGGAEGTVLKAGTTKKTFSVDLAAVRKEINAFLDKMKEKKEKEPSGKKRPVELKALRVIAFIQDDSNTAVLQAAQADVEAE
jgi:hypothetical protein